MTKTLTPPAEMRAAAQLLHDRAHEARAEMAVSRYWQGARTFADGIDNAVGGATGQLAGLMSPNVAAYVSMLLRQQAKRWEREVVDDRLHDVCDGAIGEDCDCFVHVLGVARAVLAEAESAPVAPQTGLREPLAGAEPSEASG